MFPRSSPQWLQSSFSKRISHLCQQSSPAAEGGKLMPLPRVVPHSLDPPPSRTNGRKLIEFFAPLFPPSTEDRSQTRGGETEEGGRGTKGHVHLAIRPERERGKRGELSQSVCSAVCPLFCLSEYGGSGKGSFLLFKFKFEIHFLGFCSWNVQSWEKE